MIANSWDNFPSTDNPSRSSLHPYFNVFKYMMQSLDEIETASRVMIEEFALQGVGDKASALLVQAKTSP